MAFTASLRKILLVLLLVMGLFLMILYLNENQSILKPASSFFVNTYDKQSANSQIKLVKIIAVREEDHDNQIRVPPEKTWTYKCANDRCLREHFTPSHDNYDSSFSRSDKRVTFLTCSMLCGPSNIWPEPTIKNNLGTSSVNFRLQEMLFKINTPFRNVEHLLESAFSVFLEEIKGSHSDLKYSTSYHNHESSKSSHHKEKRSVSFGSDSQSNVHRNFDTKQDALDNHGHAKNNTHVTVLVHVIKHSEVYMSLTMDESYNLTIAHEKNNVEVKIDAHSFFGARHGLNTLQQLIWYDDEEKSLKVINKAQVEDAPKFNYRGLMLDTSRHFFSVEAIKRTLVGMAHSKLNRFHWHITDSQSFPFVSKHYPELAKYGAYSSLEVYTNDDVKEVAEFAKVRGIQVIPEIDAPAHAGNGWDWGPKKGLGELSLCINQQPWNYYCGEPPCGQLNPKNNNTFLILQKLYEELLELTGPTDYFHIGGDEVNLECWAQFFNDTDLRSVWCDFMLQAFNRLKIANKGVAPKLVSVWSSGLTSFQCLSKNNFAVQVWGGSTWQENYQLLDMGFPLVISHVDAWYLDCGFGSWRSTGEGACSPYRTWQQIYKHKPWYTMRLNKQQMSQILGAEVCLWSEQVDEGTLDSRLWPRAGALAERLWSDPQDEHDYEGVPKETFNRMSAYRNRLMLLGLKAEPIFPRYCAQNQNECI